MSHRFSGWVGAVVLVLLAASAACGSRDNLFVTDDGPAPGSGEQAGAISVGGQAGTGNFGGRAGTGNFGGRAGGAGFAGRGGSVGFAGSSAFGGTIGFAGSSAFGGSIGFAGSAAVGGFAGFGNVGGVAGSSGFSCSACLAQVSPDNLCLRATCDFVNNACQIATANEGLPCADGNLCDESVCEQGKCVSHVAVACPPTNSPCVTAACDPKTGKCASTPLSGTACDDGDPCTPKDQCTMGKCLPGAATTTCQNNDKCCPAGCNIGTDNDCKNSGQVVILANDRGWYSSNGVHLTDNKNTFTGFSTQLKYNSYFNFDLSAVTGKITSAQLVLEEEAFFGPDMSETASIWDVTESASVLSTSTQSTIIFQDLQSGNQYGSVTGTFTGIGMLLTTALSNQALTDLNAARGRSFSLGVHIDTLSGQQQMDEGLRFGMGIEPRKNELILTVQ